MVLEKVVKNEPRTQFPEEDAEQNLSNRFHLE